MSGVYKKYFDSNKNIIEEITLSETENQDQLKLLEKKILDLELKNNKINNEIPNTKSETNKILKEKKEEQEKGFAEATGYNNFFSVGKKNQWKEKLDKKQINKIEENFNTVMKKFNYKLSEFN